ncbi:MAG: branched-chain-amino-acid transaminase [Candidatus Omnitrophota bacterium]|nr:branched-chain-amino-acid transaminase [Candidatus Omnitrophota bacterium]
MKKIWINGKFVDPDKAKVSVFDRGFMYGDGVFETMRSYAGTIFKLDRHLDRIFQSMDAIGIRRRYSKRLIEKAIRSALRINDLSGAYIKFTVTRGEGRFGISYKDEFSANVVIVAKEFDGYPSWMFDDGLDAKIIGVQNEMSITSGIKSLNYLPSILARFDAKRLGFDEAILTNTKGYIAEAATSNIFIVKNKALITPSIESGILPGVTRGVVIEIAKRLKMSVKKKLVTRNELFGADELFLTNSLAEVLPVTKVDSKCVGTGRVGPITKLLHTSYQKEVIRESLQ